MMLQFVPSGVFSVAQSPALICAIVAPGYVVCVCLRDKDAGGITHIGYESLLGDDRDQKISTQINRFLDELRTHGELEGATVQIVGGADTLKMYPQRTRQEQADKIAMMIGQQLIDIGMKVNRVRVGGTKARKVRLVLPSGYVEVRPISRKHRNGNYPSGGVNNPIEKPQPSKINNDFVVQMGCIKVAKSPCRLVAILGSCVGITLFDSGNRIGGLAHVLMPQSNGKTEGNDSKGHYVDIAVPALIEELSFAGADIGGLKAKLYGGANVLHSVQSEVAINVAKKNILKSREALDKAGIEVIDEDVGGSLGRKIFVHLEDFQVTVKRLYS